jgi:hypothetical protein
MKYYLYTDKTNKMLIGESFPNGPFQLRQDKTLGINTFDDWRNLITVYGRKVEYVFDLTPEGLREDGQIVPSFLLLELMVNTSGFVKTVYGDTVRFTRQKGIICDEINMEIPYLSMIEQIQKSYLMVAS